MARGAKFWFCLSFMLAYCQFTWAASIQGQIVLDESLDQATIDLSQQNVRLSIYKDKQEIAAAEVSCDENGKFHFKDLENGPEYSYLYYAVFQKVPYIGESVTFKSKENLLKLKPLKVYASSDDLAKIKSDETFFISIGDKDVMTVTQHVNLHNIGDKSYHYSPSKSEQALEYVLMEGAYGLQFISGIYTSTFDIDEDTKKLKFVEDLLPGKNHARTLKFSYLVPIKSRNKQYVSQINIVRENLSVFIDNQSVDFSAQGLEQQANMQMFGKMQKVFKGGPISAKAPLNFEFKKLPTMATFTLRILVFGAILALLLFVALIVFDKKLKTSDEEKKQRIYQSLIELKRQYNANKINKDTYQRQKETLTQYLVYFEKQSNEN